MSAARDQSIERADVTIRVGRVTLAADLVMPANAVATVIQVGHERGVHWLADHLASEAHFASLSLDLRAGPEEPIDLAVLAQRLSVVTDWVAMHATLRYLPLGYCATGVSAAASLITASTRREVRAVVSRAGRPDLAGHALENVRVPTLLVVDETDDALVALNRSARPRMRTSDLAIVPKATIDARAADYLVYALT